MIAYMAEHYLRPLHVHREFKLKQISGDPRVNRMMGYIKETTYRQIAHECKNLAKAKTLPAMPSDREISKWMNKEAKSLLRERIKEQRRRQKAADEQARKVLGEKGVHVLICCFPDRA